MTISRCPACPCCPNRSPVPSSGPTPCRILCLAEAPHKHEDANGVPLIGPTGQEFNEMYLPLAGLTRESVHVTNSVLCSQPSYRNPKPEEAAICSAKHLPALLDRVRPQIIVTMGAVAASLFPSISLALHHGIPQWVEYAGQNYILLPTYHPSAGMHATGTMIPLRDDFRALGKLIKELDAGTFTWPQDPYPTPDYQVCRSGLELETYLYPPYGPYIHGTHIYEVSNDTEYRPDSTPYCVTISHTPGTGRLIYARDSATTSAYSAYLHRHNPLQLFHNYLADKGPFSVLGLPIPSRRFLDTMVRAFELGLGGGGDEDDGGAARGSLGLKTLAYRHCHMAMASFTDVTTPHCVPHLLDWLLKAQSFSHQPDPPPTCLCGHPRSWHQPRGKSGRLSGSCTIGWETGLISCPCLRYSPAKPPAKDRDLSLLHRRITNLTTAIFESQPGLDPWKRMSPETDPDKGGWQPWELDMLTQLLGPIPVRDIALVPEPDLLAYACRDPDATLRLNTFLNTYRIPT